MDSSKHAGNKESGINETESKVKQTKREETEHSKETNSVRPLGNDYWDRVATDIATGYKNKEDKNSILNVDQVAGDNERCDTPPK